MELRCPSLVLTHFVPPPFCTDEEGRQGTGEAGRGDRQTRERKYTRKRNRCAAWMGMTEELR